MDSNSTKGVFRQPRTESSKLKEEKYEQSASKGDLLTTDSLWFVSDYDSEHECQFPNLQSDKSEERALFWLKDHNMADVSAEVKKTESCMNLSEVALQKSKNQVTKSVPDLINLFKILKKFKGYYNMGKFKKFPKVRAENQEINIKQYHEGYVILGNLRESDMLVQNRKHNSGTDTPENKGSFENHLLASCQLINNEHKYETRLQRSKSVLDITAISGNNLQNKTQRTKIRHLTSRAESDHINTRNGKNWSRTKTEENITENRCITSRKIKYIAEDSTRSHIKHSASMKDVRPFVSSPSNCASPDHKCEDVKDAQPKDAEKFFAHDKVDEVMETLRRIIDEKLKTPDIPKYDTSIQTHPDAYTLSSGAQTNSDISTREDSVQHESYTLSSKVQTDDVKISNKVINIDRACSNIKFLTNKRSISTEIKNSDIGFKMVAKATSSINIPTSRPERKENHITQTDIKKSHITQTEMKENHVTQTEITAQTIESYIKRPESYIKQQRERFKNWKSSLVTTNENKLIPKTKTSSKLLDQKVAKITKPDSKNIEPSNVSLSLKYFTAQDSNLQDVDISKEVISTSSSYSQESLIVNQGSLSSEAESKVSGDSGSFQSAVMSKRTPSIMLSGTSTSLGDETSLTLKNFYNEPVSEALNTYCSQTQVSSVSSFNYKKFYQEIGTSRLIQLNETYLDPLRSKSYVDFQEKVKNIRNSVESLDDSNKDITTDETTTSEETSSDNSITEAKNIKDKSSTNTIKAFSKTDIKQCAKMSREQVVDLLKSVSTSSQKIKPKNDLKVSKPSNIKSIKEDTNEIKKVDKNSARKLEAKTTNVNVLVSTESRNGFAPSRCSLLPPLLHGINASIQSPSMDKIDSKHHHCLRRSPIDMFATNKSTQMFEYVTENDLRTLDWINWNLFKVNMDTHNLVLGNKERDDSEETMWSSTRSSL